MRFARDLALAADLSGVAEVDEAAAGELPTVVRTSAERSPHGVDVGEELMYVRSDLRLTPLTVRPHLPRGAVDAHDQVMEPANACLVGADKVDVHHLHWPPRVRFRPSRYPGSPTLCLQTSTTRLQRSRLGDAVLPRQTLVNVAATEVNVGNSRTWQGFQQ